MTRRYVRSDVERPIDAEIGARIIEDGRALVNVGPGLWVWFPSEADAVLEIAMHHGWFTFSKSESDTVHKCVKLIVGVRRPSTADTKGREYRLRWDTKDASTFRYIEAYERTQFPGSDVWNKWETARSIGDIKSTIVRNPVTR